MRRSTARSTRPSTGSARRKTASRSRTSKRGRKPSAPLLTPAQAREAGGIVIAGAGLLSLIAMVIGGGPALTRMHEQISALFGVGWPLPVALAIGLGGLLIWPVRVLPRPADAGAALLAVLALFGLASIASRPVGGRLGVAVSGPMAAVLGRPASVLLLVVVIVVGLIVTVHFSPGGLILGVLHALRAAYAERQRIEGLVQRAERTKRVPRQADPASEASNALVPAAVEQRQVVAPEPAPEAAPSWLSAVPDELPVMGPEAEPDSDDLEDQEGPPVAVPLSAHAEEEPEGRSQPVMQVVADPEDEDEWADVDWKLPSMSLLDSIRTKRVRLEEEIKRNVRVIETTLQTFGVQARVIGVNSGPAVTQYELQPAAGVAVKRIVSLQNDLSLALAASPLRIEAPIPGKSAVGVEVPNKSAAKVSLREVVESPAFNSGPHTLAVALGHDVTGQPIVADLTRMPHLLIAGATGQGKSVCINALISSLLLQATPAELRLVMVDPKRVELNYYNGLPHLAVPVIIEPHHAAAALRWAVAEMDRRYRLLSTEGVRNIQAYNEKAAKQQARHLPYVVVVIDELADLMMVAAGEIEELICRIAQLARAVGIHLVVATQRPSTDIITGLIKANMPSRIAFAVGSQVDSRVILDTSGAEKLLGQGDMLYQPIDAGKPLRIQGAFVSPQEVENLVESWKQQADTSFIEEVLDSATGLDGREGGSSRKLDPLFPRAARAVCAEGTASVSLIQRKFNVGYSRAGRVVDQLAEHRVIGGYQGSKSREILLTLPDVDELLERLGIEG